MTMNRLSPLVLSVVGDSGAGKTTLIERLIRELSGRNYRVAAVKHCPRGFDLDVAGKDSWRFTQAGASGVFLTSPGRVGLIEDIEPVPGLKSIAEHYFPSFDVVLGEGFSGDRDVAKIAILRKGVSQHIKTPQDETLAIVSNFEIKADKPVFDPDDVTGIADFIERLLGGEGGAGNSVTLIINGKSVPLNAFVQSVIKKVITGIVDTLKREEETLKEIRLIINLGGDEGQEE